MRLHMKTAILSVAFALIIPSYAIAEPKPIPPNCFKLALPKQPAGNSVLGIGITESRSAARKPLNEVKLSLSRASADNVVMSITAIRDFHLVLSDATARELVRLLAEVRELDRRLVRQGRDSYNEPLFDIPVVDGGGKRHTLVLGVSRIAQWTCFSDGEWTPLSGIGQTFLVLRMPFALEYSPDHEFTGLQFDQEAVAKLSRTLTDLLDMKQGNP